MLMLVAALVAGVAITTDPSSYDNELHDSFFTTLSEDIPDADHGGGGCVDVSTPFHEWVGGVWQVEDTEECFLARRKLEVYWDRVKNLPPDVPSTHKDISIHPCVPIPVKKRVEKAVKKHKRIFDTTAETGMPLACHGEPVKIELKPDAKPRLCPEPTWGHGAKRAILTEWAEGKLKSGEFEFRPDGRWASRPHEVEKRKRGSPKDSNDYDIRVCGDYVYVNSQSL